MTPNLCRLQLCSNAMESDKESCGFWKQGAAGAVVWLLDTARYMQYSMYCITTAVCPMPKKVKHIDLFYCSNIKFSITKLSCAICAWLRERVRAQPDNYLIRLWISLLHNIMEHYVHTSTDYAIVKLCFGSSYTVNKVNLIKKVNSLLLQAFLSLQKSSSKKSDWNQISASLKWLIIV